MKFSPFIPPVIALVLAIGWLGARRQMLSGLERDGAELRQKIAVFNGARAAETATPTGDDPLDWRKLAAAALRANRMGVGGPKLIERFKSLSNEEIVQALEQAAQMDAGSIQLRGLLIEAWLAKDPTAALNQLAPIFQPGDRNIYQLEAGMRKWAEEDPAAAARWFDQAAAEGVFVSKRLDGGNELRDRMQDALVATLISKDPAEAERRLAELPESRRGGIISTYAISPVPESDQANFAKLVRILVSESDQINLLKAQAYQLGMNGELSEVTGYLHRIEASPEERTTCVNDAARGWLAAQSRSSRITATEIDAMREWANAEAPETTDVATGRALGSFGDRNFEKMADFALKYNETSPDDQVLTSFIDTLDPQQHEFKTRPWAKSLSDERLRELILNKLR